MEIHVNPLVVVEPFDVKVSSMHWDDMGSIVLFLVFF